MRLVSFRLVCPGLARERDCVRREGLDKWPRGVHLSVQGADGHVGCTARAELHVEHGLDDWHNMQYAVGRLAAGFHGPVSSDACIASLVTVASKVLGGCGVAPDLWLPACRDCGIM